MSVNKGTEQGKTLLRSMKAEYISKINALLAECNDISLLDLIAKILEKENTR